MNWTAEVHQPKTNFVDIGLYQQTREKTKQELLKSALDIINPRDKIQLIFVENTDWYIEIFVWGKYAQKSIAQKKKNIKRILYANANFEEIEQLLEWGMFLDREFLKEVLDKNPDTITLNIKH